MRAAVTKLDDEKPPSFGELDRVKLKKAISAEGRPLGRGLIGTIVLCHGSRAYEVEFDEIADVFGIPAEYLQKL